MNRFVVLVVALEFTVVCHFLFRLNSDSDSDSPVPSYALVSPPATTKSLNLNIKSKNTIDQNNTTYNNSYHTMPSSIKYQNPEPIQKVIDHLKNDVGINFLALDFDQTILDIHTGGNWKGSLEELFPHIRPVYAQLIVAALTNQMEVAIVTFTCQTKFVRGVLDYIFSVGLEEGFMDPQTLESIGVMTGIGNTVDTSHRIPIRGGDRSWKYNGMGSVEGKQPHMASAVEELEFRRENDFSHFKAVKDLADSNSGGVSTPPPNETEKEEIVVLETPVYPDRSNRIPERRLELQSHAESQYLSEPITRNTTLLLDDDARNIRHALENDVRAVWFNPKKPNKLLPELLRLK